MRDEKLLDGQLLDGKPLDGEPHQRSAWLRRQAGGLRERITRLRQRPEWQFFAALRHADPVIAAGWWLLLALRGALPAGFALAMGGLVGAVEKGRPLTAPLAALGVIFVALQVLTPIHQAVSANLGDKTAAWLYDRLTHACIEPPGLGHLEDSQLTTDLTTAREFDLGMTGPPLSLSVDFIASGLVGLLGGLACALVLFGYAWWAPPLVAGAWLCTHWMLRESGVWRDRNTDEVRAAQRDADYLYRLAVDQAPAKELRLFGLADWVVQRFVARRTRLHRLQYEATRLRERSVLATLAVVLAANLVLFIALGVDVAAGRLDLSAVVVFAQSAVGASAIAFGGLNWALDGAAAPVAAVARFGPAAARAGALAGPRDTASGVAAKPSTAHPDPVGRPAREIRFCGVTFGYPGGAPVLSGLDLSIPAGTSLAIVGRNGAGKTTLAKLVCRLYDPVSGHIEVDGIDIRQFDVDRWRSRITAVFQDFIRFELSLRDNVAPKGASDERITAALADAGAAGLTELDTVLAKGYAGGTDLSGGQWQRVALARALCAVRLGAGVVLLDEPTAQLDVRGEAEIFRRILAATRGATTILISHRFSTVRQADQICVLDHGRVAELGSHDELMAADGLYRHLFDLQAQRFAAGLAVDEQDEEVSYDLLS